MILRYFQSRALPHASFSMWTVLIHIWNVSFRKWDLLRMFCCRHLPVTMSAYVFAFTLCFPSPTGFLSRDWWTPRDCIDLMELPSDRCDPSGCIRSREVPTEWIVINLIFLTWHLEQTILMQNFLITSSLNQWKVTIKMILLRQHNHMMKSPCLFDSIAAHFYISPRRLNRLWVRVETVRLHQKSFWSLFMFLPTSNTFQHKKSYSKISRFVNTQYKT